MNYFLVVSIMPDRPNQHRVWRVCFTEQAARKFRDKANKDLKKSNPTCSVMYMIVKGYETKGSYIFGDDLKKRAVIL